MSTRHRLAELLIIFGSGIFLVTALSYWMPTLPQVNSIPALAPLGFALLYVGGFWWLAPSQDEDTLEKHHDYE